MSITDKNISQEFVKADKFYLSNVCMSYGSGHPPPLSHSNKNMVSANYLRSNHTQTECVKRSSSVARLY